MRKLVWVFLVWLLFATGCNLFQTKEEKAADELAADGMEYFEDGNFKEAIASFEQLKDWYPFSKYTILAELKIGDAHYYRKEYEEAIVAYEEFESLHPRNEAVPYVIYQIGQCYYKQVVTIDRDQTSTRKALDSFTRLIKSHPESEYARKGYAYLSKCRKVLAGHDLYVGMYYYKGKHYKAALSRFQSIVTNYPDSGVHQKALQYIAVCEESIRKQELEEMQEADGTTESKRFWKFW